MTASIVPVHPGARGATRLPGLRALVRKDVTEWSRGRRAWVILAISTLFMALTAANGFIIDRIARMVPEAEAPDLPVSLVPLENFVPAVGAQIFVLAAIFGVASLIVRERESGTLAWLASKPVSRGSIWMAKFVTASVMLAVTAVVVPVAITTIVVAVLYGAVDPSIVGLLTVGAVASVVLYVAIGLVLGTLLPGQPAIAAGGFVIFAVAPLVAGLLGPIGAILPTGMLEWSMQVASGAPVGIVTPVAWLATVAGLIVVGIVRTRHMEL